VWSGKFRPRTRTTIRKAEQAGLEIESGNGPRQIEAFYGLLQRSVDRWAHHQHESLTLARWRAARRDPIKKFDLLAQAMGPALRIWVARHQGQPAAAILVLQHHNAHYTRGAMDEALAGPTAANYLLHHLAIEAACAAGCSSYHMGETGQSGPLAQFKSRFGAVATPYTEFLHEKIPLHWLNSSAKTVVKRLIGFRDV
jgi:lipid II:glycine glycyltransferase (peptidoglycan interpeptide bridge formation enzyme)